MIRDDVAARVEQHARAHAVDAILRRGQGKKFLGGRPHYCAFAVDVDDGRPDTRNGFDHRGAPGFAGPRRAYPESNGSESAGENDPTRQADRSPGISVVLRWLRIHGVPPERLGVWGLGDGPLPAKREIGWEEGADRNGGLLRPERSEIIS